MAVAWMMPIRTSCEGAGDQRQYRIGCAGLSHAAAGTRSRADYRIVDELADGDGEGLPSVIVLMLRPNMAET